MDGINEDGQRQVERGERPEKRKKRKKQKGKGSRRANAQEEGGCGHDCIDRNDKRDRR